jgi:hypothetical protein
MSEDISSSSTWAALEVFTARTLSRRPVASNPRVALRRERDAPRTREGYCEQVQTSQPWLSNAHWIRSNGQAPLAARSGHPDDDGDWLVPAGVGPSNRVLVDSITGCFGMLSKVPLVMHPRHAAPTSAARSHADTACRRAVDFGEGMSGLPSR